MPHLAPTSPHQPSGSPPFGQVASGVGRAHVGSLRSSAHAFRRIGTSHPVAGTRAQVAGTRAQVAGTTPQIFAKAAQVAGITPQFSSKAAQLAVFEAGAPNTPQTKASDQLFRSMSGEDLFPPISQVANEMTETQRQAGPQGRRS